MTVTPSSNKGLNSITVGTESGTWGPFVNNTTAVLDNALGGLTAIAVSNTNVVLSSAQYACNFIQFTGNLSANITVTLPAAGSLYTIQNLVTNPTAYSITLNTAAGGRAIGAPWVEPTNIMTDGTNVEYCSLGHVGSYIDIAAQAIPNWISVCTVAPYLYCNGTTFSSVTFPALASFLGGNTLPDCRGRTRFAINDTSSRITNTYGLNGDTLLNGGGFDTVTVVNDSYQSWEIAHVISQAVFSGPDTTGQYGVNPNPVSPIGPLSNRPPAIIAGITMIRAG